MINIININLSEIEKAIHYHYAKTISKADYLIMNRDTFESIKASVASYNIEFKAEKTNNVSCKLFGVDIAICESLRFGEIDIR